MWAQAPGPSLPDSWNNILAARTTLLDLANVLDIAREILDARGLGQRATCCQANILEPWPVPDGCYDLVLLSNVIHVYSEQELPGILTRAARCLNPTATWWCTTFSRGTTRPRPPCST